MLRSLWPFLALLWFVGGTLNYSCQPAQASSEAFANLTEVHEVAAIRTYFYVGGKYVTV